MTTGISQNLVRALAGVALLGLAVAWCLFAWHLLDVRCGASCDLDPSRWEQDDGSWQWYAQLPLALGGLGVALWTAIDTVRGRTSRAWLQLALVLALFDAWILFTSRAAIALP